MPLIKSHPQASRPAYDLGSVNMLPLINLCLDSEWLNIGSSGTTTQSQDTLSAIQAACLHNTA